MATTIITGKVRFSYVQVHEPYAQDGDATPKYKICLLIPAEDERTLNKINTAIEQAVELGKSSKWGGKKPRNLKLPLRDGEEKENEEFHGCFFLNASSLNKPGIVDADRDEIINNDEFYSGCYGRAQINFFAYDSNGNKGVGVGLLNLQKLEDGERLGGVAQSAYDAFEEEYEEEEEGYDMM